MNPHNETKIRPIPTVEGFKKMVDTVIEPATPDSIIKTLIDLILTTANTENDDLGPLAQAAARHAFTHSEAFETAFRSFAGWPESVPYAADRYIVEAVKEV